MNRNTPTANVGMNHLRSLGFKAGRKNARICHRIMGMHATTDAHSATLKRMVNEPNTSSTFKTTMPSSPLGR